MAQKIYGDLEVVGAITSRGALLGTPTQIFKDGVLIRTVFGDITSGFPVDMDSFLIGSSAGVICGDAFFSSQAICELIIPPGVVSIGEAAFGEAFGLTGDLTFPEGVDSIGAYAFVECSGLGADLTIPPSVTFIGEGAFLGCSGIEEVFCHVERSVINVLECLIDTSVVTLHARASDATWTAGADTIGDHALTVVKDL